MEASLVADRLLGRVVLHDRAPPQILSGLFDVASLHLNEALGSAHGGRVAVLVEDQRRVVAVEGVEVLEGAVGGLGVEEPDDRQEQRVSDDPDNIKPPAQLLDADGRDLDDDEVGDPVRHRRDGRALGAHRQRVDLRRVQPRDA